MAMPIFVRAPATLNSRVATTPVKTSGSIQWKLRVTHAPILPITVKMSNKAFPMDTRPRVNSGALNFARKVRSTVRIEGSNTSYACMNPSVSWEVTCAHNPLVVFCFTNASSEETPWDPPVYMKSVLVVCRSSSGTSSPRYRQFSRRLPGHPPSTRPSCSIPRKCPL